MKNTNLNTLIALMYVTLIVGFSAIIILDLNNKISETQAVLMFVSMGLSAIIIIIIPASFRERKNKLMLKYNFYNNIEEKNRHLKPLIMIVLDKSENEEIIGLTFIWKYINWNDGREGMIFDFEFQPEELDVKLKNKYSKDFHFIKKYFSEKENPSERSRFESLIHGYYERSMESNKK